MYTMVMKMRIADTFTALKNFKENVRFLKVRVFVKNLSRVHAHYSGSLYIQRYNFQLGTLVVIKQKF